VVFILKLTKTIIEQKITLGVSNHEEDQLSGQSSVSVQTRCCRCKQGVIQIFVLHLAVVVMIAQSCFCGLQHQPAGVRDIQNAETHELNKTAAFLALTNAEEETSAAQEPQTSEETDEGEGSGGPQEGLEEVHGSARGI
jgi:hypothetical protein